MFKKIALLGIGLIGSSISHGIRRGSLSDNIAIYTRSNSTLEEARKLCLGNTYTTNPIDVVKGADLVIICVPVGAYKQLAIDIAPYLSPGAIVTDVGSVKGRAFDDIITVFDGITDFVPAHPLAGTESSGPSSGFAGLFDGRWCIITPLDSNNSASVTKVSIFWQKLGSIIEYMDRYRHDLVVSVVSHIPHLIAYCMVDTGSRVEVVNDAEIMRYSASGFRDFTRIASSDPVMWRDIMLANGNSILEVLDVFKCSLESLEQAIKDKDGKVLEEIFTKTRGVRKGIIEMGQDNSAINFGRNLSNDNTK